MQRALSSRSRRASLRSGRQCSWLKTFVCKRFEVFVGWEWAGISCKLVKRSEWLRFGEILGLLGDSPGFGVLERI
jgi:hypothetical protein